MLSEPGVDLRQPVRLEKQLLKAQTDMDTEVGASMLQLLQVQLWGKGPSLIPPYGPSSTHTLVCSFACLLACLFIICGHLSCIHSFIHPAIHSSIHTAIHPSVHMQLSPAMYLHMCVEWDQAGIARRAYLQFSCCQTTPCSASFWTLI